MLNHHRVHGIPVSAHPFDASHGPQPGPTHGRLTDSVPTIPTLRQRAGLGCGFGLPSVVPPSIETEAAGSKTVSERS